MTYAIWHKMSQSMSIWVSKEPAWLDQLIYGFSEKCKKLKSQYFTIVHFDNSLVKIKWQIYVPKSSWNNPKSILFIKVCTITTFFQVLHRKIKFFEKLTHPNATPFIFVSIRNEHSVCTSGCFVLLRQKLDSCF